MINCFFKSDTILKKNKYDILEPVYKNTLLNNNLIDVIFIPLFVFDIYGYRIGYGKGFYDKFIYLCRKNIIKIGLGYFPPIEKIPYIHKNDLVLDIGITPNKIFIFQ